MNIRMYYNKIINLARKAMSELEEEFPGSLRNSVLMESINLCNELINMTDNMEKIRKENDSLAADLANANKIIEKLQRRIEGE